MSWSSSGARICAVTDRPINSRRSAASCCCADQGRASGTRPRCCAASQKTQRESFKDPRFGALIATGGDTMEAILDLLNVREFEILQELDPGFPLGHARLGDGRSLLLAMKAGGFGSDDALERAVARIRGAAQPLHRIHNEEHFSPACPHDGRRIRHWAGDRGEGTCEGRRTRRRVRQLCRHAGHRAPARVEHRGATHRCTRCGSVPAAA